MADEDLSFPFRDLVGFTVDTHADGATAEVRNHIMSNLTPEQWYDKLGWLYGGTGLDA